MESIPNEILEKICDRMDVGTLSQFMQSNKHIQNVCSRILKQKKGLIMEEMEEMEEIEEYQWELVFYEDIDRPVLYHIEDQDRQIYNFYPTGFYFSPIKRTTLVKLDENFDLGDKGKGYYITTSDAGKGKEKGKEVPIVFSSKDAAEEYLNEDLEAEAEEYQIKKFTITHGETYNKLKEYS